MNSFSWSDWATSGIEIIYLTDCLYDRPAVRCKIRIQVWQVEMIFEPIETQVWPWRALTYVYYCHSPITTTNKIVTGYEPTQVTEIWMIDWEQNNTKKTKVVSMHDHRALYFSCFLEAQSKRSKFPMKYWCLWTRKEYFLIYCKCLLDKIG